MMIAIAREFILSRYQLCASKSDLQHGNNSIIIFFWNLDFLYFSTSQIFFLSTSRLFFVNISIISTFFQIADPAAAYHYGITTLPTLVYFKNSVPNLFDGEDSFSSKRKKSYIMSARQICLSPEKIMNVWNYKSEICQNLDEIVGLPPACGT